MVSRPFGATFGEFHNHPIVVHLRDSYGCQNFMGLSHVKR